MELALRPERCAAISANVCGLVLSPLLPLLRSLGIWVSVVLGTGLVWGVGAGSHCHLPTCLAGRPPWAQEGAEPKPLALGSEE